MTFKEFDKQMRKYEEKIDQKIDANSYIAVRLDGKGFTKMTLNNDFKKPFDTYFRDKMVATTSYLMTDSRFNIIYGYTQSDEISLLFSPNENTFNRKVRKINTTLAGMASAFFSRTMYSTIATFDCRVIPLPDKDIVADYFIWRQEDSQRNALNGWCYWTLVQKGNSKRKANSLLNKKLNDEKIALLDELGIDYNEVPSWQKNGVGMHFIPVTKMAFNKKTGDYTEVQRKFLDKEFNLKTRDEYREFIKSLLP